jgi:hypothetical protein
MVKWVLVYIILSGSDPVAVNAAGPRITYDTMTECFVAREQLSFTVGGQNGYFPNGTQAVCVPTQEK